MKGDMRLVAVVLGSEDNKRFNDVTTLTGYGFRHFNTVKLFTANEPIKEVGIIAGVADTISVGVAEDIILTLSNDERADKV